MLKKNFIYKLFLGFALLGGLFTFTSCEQGLEFEEAPEANYSEVGVNYFAVRSRELFENKIYAINWDKWVDYYIDTRELNRSTNAWKNEGTAPVTLSDGTVLQPGESAGGTIDIVKNASMPGGELHIITVVVPDHVTYSTANKGYLFDGSKFTGSFKLINPDANNRSQQVRLPIKKKELVVDMLFAAPATYDCVLEPQDGAPVMGKPGDFTKPHRYLVKNIAYRPKGVPQATRMYELRVVFAPVEL